MSKFLKEFKDFAVKGNVVDMAVGVVIGGAFGKIVTSLVNDIIMPLVGALTGGLDFTSLRWVIKPAVLNADGTVKVAEAALKYGNFIQTTVDFLIIAFSIFLVIKAINKAKNLHSKKEAAAEAAAKAAAEAAPVAPAPKPADITLLEEIRDLLKEKK